MSNQMQVPQGTFELNRFPFAKKEPLRAWDAADEYLLNYFSENISSESSLNILVLNDSFGAVSIPLLAEHHVALWSDSYLTEQGVNKNRTNNSVTSKNYQFIKSTETPSLNFDVVLMKLPKSNALLEDQLIRLLPLINDKTIFVAAAMAKNIHSSTLKFFEKIIGETKTSLAVKKARLIFCKTISRTENVASPYPKSYQLENTEYNICNHANVFSREKLDIGTRFLLEYIPTAKKYNNIVDMGCGNGIVGLMAAEKQPQASLVFTDESYMAIESARENLKTSGLGNTVQFQAMDCLQFLDSNSADLILNNPPFHQQHATGDAVAWRMFNDAKRVLRKDGELIVVANRHLAYHLKLKKIFNNCETIANNKKFVILKAIKK
jgi:23S rRNA (guanine1835-N2)-methyltransferase